MSYWTVSNTFLSYPVSLIAKFIRINASFLASSDNTLQGLGHTHVYIPRIQQIVP